MADKARESAEDVGENHRHELPKGGVVFIDLDAHHGALPGIEQERCECAGVAGGTDRASALRLADAGLKRASPRGKNRGETLAHRTALIGELDAKIADQTAPGVTQSRNIAGQ